MIKLLVFVALAFIAYRIVVGLMKVPNVMPRAEAAKLLGIEASAGSEAVLDAHRRLIAKVHPDAGGSAELAARINQARDTMLKP